MSNLNAKKEHSRAQKFEPRRRANAAVCALGLEAPAQEIIDRDIDSLKLDPRNPRRHSPDQIKKLAALIAKIGFVGAVIIDKKKNVICGHARIQAARQAGLTKIPTIQVSHLSEAELRLFQIADNKLATLSDWDERLLADMFRGLQSIDLDFSLDLTGFSTGEIDLVLGSAPPQDNIEDEAESLPPIEGHPVTKRGQAWKAGPHRILCADSREDGSFKSLMAGECAAAAFTDPPYNVALAGNVTGLGKTRHREFAVASGELTNAQFHQLLAQIYESVRTYCADGAIVFACMDWRHVDAVLSMISATRGTLLNLCVWVKHNAGMGSFFRSQHELVFVIKYGRSPHRNNVALGRHGRNRSNVWNYRGANDFGRGAGEGDLLADHPTPKPVSMIADAILDCTSRDEIVLDVFLGGGATLIAAERTGRRCFGIEIDPIYVDASIRRWQRFTGKSAVCAESGRTFDACQVLMEKSHAR